MIKVIRDWFAVRDFAEDLVNQERLAGARGYASDFYGPKAAKVYVRCTETPDDDGGDSDFDSVTVCDAEGKELQPDPTAPGWVDPENRTLLADLYCTVNEWAQEWREYCADPEYAQDDPLPDGWEAFQREDWVRLWVELHHEEAADTLAQLWYDYLSCHTAAYDVHAHDELPEFALVLWGKHDAQQDVTAAFSAAVAAAVAETDNATGGALRAGAEP